MSGPFRVLIVSSAARAIVEAAEWWVANRPKAPGAFAEELERALQLLSLQPLIGAQARNVKLAVFVVFTFPAFITTSTTV